MQNAHSVCFLEELGRDLKNLAHKGCVRSGAAPTVAGGAQLFPVALYDAVSQLSQISVHMDKCKANISGKILDTHSLRHLC